MDKFGYRMENWCAVVMLVAFFLPWVSFGPLGSYSGVQIHKIAQATETEESEKSECKRCFGIGAVNLFTKCAACNGRGYVTSTVTSTKAGSAALYFAYVIPLACVAILALAAKGKRPSKLILILTGAIPLGLLVLHLPKYGSDLFDLLGIGAWLTLLSGLGMLGAATGVIKPTAIQAVQQKIVQAVQQIVPPPPPPPPPPGADASGSPRSSTSQAHQRRGIPEEK